MHISRKSPIGDIVFDDEGVCSGCRVHEEKDEIDWIEKENEFREILNLYKNKNHLIMIVSSQ